MFLYGNCQGASIPFCLVKNRQVLLYVYWVLYVFGALFGETYSLLTTAFLHMRRYHDGERSVFGGRPIMRIREVTRGMYLFVQF